MSVTPASAHGRVAFADLDAIGLIDALQAAVDAPSDRGTATALARATFALGDVCAAVADCVLGSTGPFARLAAAGGVDAARRAVAAAELQALGQLAHLDLATALAPLGFGAVAARGDAHRPWSPPAANHLREQLAATPDWGDVVDRLTDFWRGEGTGTLATHRVMRFADGVLTGVREPDSIALSQLVGGERERGVLGSSLAAFVAGAPAVDALLYGAPGTGKSTAVRALAAAHAADGLRLIQVDRDQLEGVRDLFMQVATGPRCLILLDDLVFDDGTRTDRALRGVLEGDVAERPANVLVWATSNRMRLLHETRTEREEDLEGELGRGERSALATRFGIRQAFATLTVAQFVDIAETLVRRRTGSVPDWLDAAARRFAVDRGLTPRAARQFADLVAGGVVMEP